MRIELTENADGLNGPLMAGTQIEHPDAHRLVALGIARPIDAEAIAAHADFLAIQARIDEARRLHDAELEAQRSAAEALVEQTNEKERLSQFEAMLKETV